MMHAAYDEDEILGEGAMMEYYEELYDHGDDDDNDDDDILDIHEGEDAQYKWHSRYMEFFEDPDQLVLSAVHNRHSEGDRSGFAMDEDDTVLDLNDILLHGDSRDDDEPQQPPPPPPPPEAAATAAAAPCEAIARCPPLPLLGVTDGTVKLKESTAIKRLRKIGAVGVLYDIPAEESMNRKALQEWWLSVPELAAIASVEQVFVGYRLRVPVGVGLTICSEGEPAVNAALAAQCVALLGERNGRLLRLDVEDDVRPFYSESSVKATSEGASELREGAIPSSKKKRSANHNQGDLVRSMRDPSALRRRVDEVGGWANCRFVTIDVEAAVVHPGAVPLPLEFAFVDCARRPPQSIVDEWVRGTLDDESHSYFFFDGLNYHLLTHPGIVRPADEITAMQTSLNPTLGGWHGLPFRYYSFLRRDYIAMARSVDWLLSQPGVILINKGAPMDVHAIRWLYAAANVQYEWYGEDTSGARTNRPPPPLLSVDDCSKFMFDVHALQELVSTEAAAAAASTAAAPNDTQGDGEQTKRQGGGDATGAAPNTEPDAHATRQSRCWCWYHCLLEEVLCDAAIEERPHCAWDDAMQLAHSVAHLISTLSVERSE